jgi:hypothetical protein
VSSLRRRLRQKVAIALAEAQPPDSANRDWKYLSGWFDAQMAAAAAIRKVFEGATPNARLAAKSDAADSGEGA